MRIAATDCDGVSALWRERERERERVLERDRLVGEIGVVRVLGLP